MVRSAIAPLTMVAAVAQNTVWKIRKAAVGMFESYEPRTNRSRDPIKGLLPPNIKENPRIQNTALPRLKSIRFFMMIFPAFFALVKPVSTMANPACMKNTNTEPNNTHKVSTDTNIHYPPLKMPKGCTMVIHRTPLYACPTDSRTKKGRCGLLHIALDV